MWESVTISCQGVGIALSEDLSSSVGHLWPILLSVQAFMCSAHTSAIYGLSWLCEYCARCVCHKDKNHLNEERG